MNTVLHYVRLNYAMILFTFACLTLLFGVSYALFSTFGGYAIVFYIVGGYVSYVLSAGFINYTLGG